MAEEKKGFFSRLVEGLQKTRDAVVNGLDDLFNGPGDVDDDFYDELEEILITGDLGVRATEEILDELRDKVKEQHVKERSACRQLLIDSIKERMDLGEAAYVFEEQPSVILLVGVNGVGKTTTAGKLAAQYQGMGKRVLIAAADTFRAAAIEQLTEWANRAAVPIISTEAGGDPAAVVFDACTASKARRTDILICDTAGRLHNKKNLMEELKKINRVIDRELPGYTRETLLVLDGTTGQNALEQAREFSSVTNLSGIVLTKLDGTAKGGIAVAIQAELGIPVKFIGVGEKIDDLRKFKSGEYVDALFVRDGEEWAGGAEEAEAEEEAGASELSEAAEEIPEMEETAPESEDVRETEEVRETLEAALETEEGEPETEEGEPEMEEDVPEMEKADLPEVDSTEAAEPAADDVPQEENKPAEEAPAPKKKRWFQFW